MSDGLDRDTLGLLSAPFDPSEEKQRKGRGETVFTYIDARAVMDRLDEVVGPENWSTEFVKVENEGHAIECRLTVFGVTKADCGQADPEDEPWKSAYSDAFKRAAVHFGIGRYLYRKGPARQGPHQPPPIAQPSHLADEAQKLGLKRDNGPLPSGVAIPRAQPNAAQSRPAVSGAPPLRATDPQIKAIYAIARATLALDEQELDERCRQRYGRVPQELDRRQASAFIDELKMAVATS